MQAVQSDSESMWRFSRCAERCCGLCCALCSCPRLCGLSFLLRSLVQRVWSCNYVKNHHIAVRTASPNTRTLHPAITPIAVVISLFVRAGDASTVEDRLFGGASFARRRLTVPSASSAPLFSSPCPPNAVWRLLPPHSLLPLSCCRTPLLTSNRCQSVRRPPLQPAAAAAASHQRMHRTLISTR